MGGNLRARRWAGVLIALFLFFGLGYSLLIPMWEGPDEHAHYLLALNLARIDVFSSIEVNYEANQPQPYYRFASRLLKPLYESDPALVEYYHPRAYFRNVRTPVRIYDWTDENYRFLLGPQLLRWINLLAGGAALFINYRAMRRLLPRSEEVAVAAVLLAGLTPQYLHTVSYVSNDALGILAGATLFWMFARILTGRSGAVQFGVFAAAALVLPPTTKMTVLPMGVAVLVALIWRAGSRLRSSEGWPIVAGIVAGLALAAALILLSPPTLEILVGELEFRAFSYLNGAFTPTHFWEMTSQLVWSYWGKVGWLAVGLPVAAVVAMSALALAGAAANLRSLIRALRSGDDSFVARTTWSMLWLAAGLALLVVFRNGLSTMNNQGRFFFPAVGLLSLLTVAGWYELLPSRLRPYLPGLVALLMAGLNLLLWFGGIIPVYYQPFLG